MVRASVRSNLFTENLATISLHLRWQGGKQQTTLGTKYGFRSKLNFISYQRSKSREPNLSQRSKNKATTVTEWPLCRQDTSMKSIYSPFPHFFYFRKNLKWQICKCENIPICRGVIAGSTLGQPLCDWVAIVQTRHLDEECLFSLPHFFYICKIWNCRIGCLVYHITASWIPPHTRSSINSLPRNVFTHLTFPRRTINIDFSR